MNRGLITTAPRDSVTTVVWTRVDSCGTDSMSLGESTTNSAPLSFLRRGGGVAGQKGRCEDYVRTVVTQQRAGIY